MTILDWIIVAVLALSVLQGLRRGFIAAVISLVGYIAGIILGCRYWFIALPVVRPFVQQIWAQQLAGIFVVALLTILAFTLIAHLLRRTAQALGLGWLDRLLGGVFGLLRGALVVVLGFILVAAFVPTAQWTHNSRLAPLFLSSARSVTRSTPAAAASRVFFGLQQWQQHLHGWWQ